MQRAEKLQAANVMTADISDLLGELCGDTILLPEIPRMFIVTTPVNRAILKIFHATKTGVTLLVCAGSEFLDDGAIAELPADKCSSIEGDFVMSRNIDHERRMELIMASGKRNPGLDFKPQAARLCDLLAGQLRVLYAWWTQPKILGAAFARFSGTQWNILCSLSSDLGEKQLADNLNLSHHTLHSHIKSIYSKLNVRSRLEAVQRLHQAARRYRIECHRWTPFGNRIENADPGASTISITERLEASRRLLMNSDKIRFDLPLQLTTDGSNV